MDPNNPNIHVLPPSDNGEDSEPTILYVHTLTEVTDPLYDPTKTKLPKFSPEELLGLAFLHDTPDGQRVCAQVIQPINDLDLDQQKHI